MKLKFAKPRPVKSPRKAYDTDAGIDFFVPEDFEQTELYPGDDIKIPSGILVNVPLDHALVFFNKSGVATEDNLFVGACVVDEGYQGEVHLHVFNGGSTPVSISPDKTLIQALLLPVPSVEMIETKARDIFSTETSRGEGGFGSSNRLDDEESILEDVYNSHDVPSNFEVVVLDRNKPGYVKKMRKLEKELADS